MAGIKFDDLIPQNKPSAVSFDDLVPKKQLQGDVNDTLIPRELRAAAYGVAGGQVPFGNVITSGIGAGIAKVASHFTGDTRTIGELYDQAQADTKAVQNESPTATTLGNVLGVVSTLPAAFSKPVQGAGVISTPAKGLKSASDFATKMVSATPFKGSGIGAKAGNIGARMAGGAAVAYPVGGLYAAGEADAGQRMEALGEGARNAAYIGAAVPALGVAVPYVAGKALDVISPSIDEGMATVGKLAQKYNIPVSFTSLTKSEPIKNFQKMSQALPLSGEEKFRTRQMEAFNRALTKSFGYESHKITPEVMNAAFRKVGAEFDNLGKGKVFGTSGFQQSIDDVLADASIYTDDALNAFSKEVDNVRSNFTIDGSISGERLGQLRTRLNRLARKTNDADKAELFKSLENSVIDMMTAGDDVAKAALSDAKRKYKNLLTVEPLANKAVGGEINPTLLANRAEKIYGRAYTTGNAGEIGELARIGKELLAKEGGSDTAPKMFQYGLGGAALTAAVNPQIGVPALATAAGGMAANRAVQSGVLRNKKLVNRALDKADDLLTIIEQGGKITNQMIATLPQTEKNKFLKQVMQMPVAKATGIFSTEKDKVK